ncbi:uncharacterized protein [Procambarus clarkii]|uniref:uncharacterized protein isoform X2 n=1 Tax=Procambarus clarkii TaxID=6728 RepID=UPI001E6769A1|nr:uncharacterized protein LOC123766556 isoform X1 [Procambarus clarkii]XP_045611762.1 uncharacterized protein LOC123766556 isoform X1 [Procambarus clarkii]
MGCGASKTVEVIEEGEDLDAAKTPTTIEIQDELTSVRSNTPDLDSKPISPPTLAPLVQPNGMESAGSPAGESLPQTPVEDPLPQSADGRPVAFEVAPVDPSESIIRRHPPRKFQKLEEQQQQQQQQGSALTQEMLEEKQAEAERRRQELLSQRVQSAKHRTARSAGRMRSRPSDGDEVEQLDDGIIESAASVNPENEL